MSHCEIINVGMALALLTGSCPCMYVQMGLDKVARLVYSSPHWIGHRAYPLMLSNNARLLSTALVYAVRCGYPVYVQRAAIMPRYYYSGYR